MLRRQTSSRSPLLVPPLLLALAAGLLLGASCGGDANASPTERLWVSGIPTGPKAPVTLFLATKATDGKYIGTFFRGSMYRGKHDVFSWRSKKAGAATIQFLQDGREVSLRIESCKPTRGFDHCMLMHGDPTGTKRYQSRKRWATRRSNATPELAPAVFAQVVVDLSEDDEELRALVER